MSNENEVFGFLSPVNRPNRGKGAKGFTTYSLFAIPVISKEEMAKDKLSSDLDYSYAVHVDELDIIEVLKEEKINVAEAMMRGYDIMVTSAELRKERETDSIKNKLIAAGIDNDNFIDAKVMSVIQNVKAGNDLEEVIEVMVMLAAKSKAKLVKK